MRPILKIFLFAASALAIFGCSKGKISVASLRAVSGFSLQNTVQVWPSRALATINVNGNCNSDTATIELSFDGVTWVPAASLATSSTVNCTSGGTFSYQYSAVTNPQFAIPNAAPTNQIYFRASGALGMTAVVPLTFTMAESNQFLTAGSSRSTAGGLTLKSRIVPTPKVQANGLTLGR